MSEIKTKEKQGHIVYAAFFENGLCAYVGSGKVGREQHLTSGVSHCYEANKHHFNKSAALNVVVLHENLSKAESMKVELTEIAKLRPTWNKYAGSIGTFSRMKNFAIKKYMEYRLNVYNAKDDYIQRDREMVEQIVKHMNIDGVAVIPKGFMFENIPTNSLGMFSKIVKGGGKYYPQLHYVFEFEPYKKGVGYVVKLRDYKGPSQGEDDE